MVQAKPMYQNQPRITYRAKAHKRRISIANLPIFHQNNNDAKGLIEQQTFAIVIEDCGSEEDISYEIGDTVVVRDSTEHSVIVSHADPNIAKQRDKINKSATAFSCVPASKIRALTDEEKKNLLSCSAEEKQVFKQKWVQNELVQRALKKNAIGGPSSPLLSPRTSIRMSSLSPLQSEDVPVLAVKNIDSSPQKVQSFLVEQKRGSDSALHEHLLDILNAIPEKSPRYHDPQDKGASPESDSLLADTMNAENVKVPVEAPVAYKPEVVQEDMVTLVIPDMPSISSTPEKPAAPIAEVEHKDTEPQQEQPEPEKEPEPIKQQPDVEPEQPEAKLIEKLVVEPAKQPVEIIIHAPHEPVHKDVAIPLLVFPTQPKVDIECTVAKPDVVPAKPVEQHDLSKHKHVEQPAKQKVDSPKQREDSPKVKPDSKKVDSPKIKPESPKPKAATTSPKILPLELSTIVNQRENTPNSSPKTNGSTTPQRPLTQAQSINEAIFALLNTPKSAHSPKPQPVPQPQPQPEPQPVALAPKPATTASKVFVVKEVEPSMDEVKKSALRLQQFRGNSTRGISFLQQTATTLAMTSTPRPKHTVQGTAPITKIEAAPSNELQQTLEMRKKKRETMNTEQLSSYKKQIEQQQQQQQADTSVPKWVEELQKKKAQRASVNYSATATAPLTPLQPSTPVPASNNNTSTANNSPNWRDEVSQKFKGRALAAKVSQPSE